LVGFVFIAVDLLVSALTSSAVTCLLVAFFVNLTLFLVPLMLDNYVKQETVKKAVSYVNLIDHFQRFGQGVVDSRPLIFYLSTIVLSLFLAVRAVEVRKWR